MGKKSSQGQAVESADTTRAQNPLSDADGAQAARKQRSPAAHQGIQVNFCKNPICANFGSPVGDKLSRAQNPYRIVSSGKGLPVGYCQSCNESFPLKSNKGIYEELERMLAFLVDATAQPCCPVDGCSNHVVPVSSGKAFYSAFGVTSTGPACTVSIRTSTAFVGANLFWSGAFLPNRIRGGSGAATHRTARIRCKSCSISCE